MNDVAIAEGDAEKGEIVISPATHALLHGFASLKSKAPSVQGSTRSGFGGGYSGVGGGAVGGSMGGDGTSTARSAQRSPSKEHPLACGCTLTPSGYFKINTGMEDELCVVDFTAAPVDASAASVMNIDPEEFEGNKELQYEFEVYAQVIDELMSGYKAVSPVLLVQFADLLKNMSVIPAEGKSAINLKMSMSLPAATHLIVLVFSLSIIQM
jgi:hypothetical protein